MQPYARVRATNNNNRDPAEGVHVGLPDAASRHGTHPIARKRLGKRTSALLSVVLGTLLVLCVIGVYLYTTVHNSSDGGAVKPHKPSGKMPVEEKEKRQTTSTTTTSADPNATPTKKDDAPPSTTPGIRKVVVPEPTTNDAPTTTFPGQYVNIFDKADTRTARPMPKFEDFTDQYETGEYQPEEPDRLPGLTVKRRNFTPAELLDKFRDTDYIYSFVNGSERNHQYRKAFIGACYKNVLEWEKAAYDLGGLVPSQMQVNLINNTPGCFPAYLMRELRNKSSAKDLITLLSKRIRTNIGDRETDELRHSIRSVEQHIQWHRGRVVMVSPGHHPTWVDGAKNFLAGTCGGAAVQALRTRGTHLRLTTVHQDAIMPYGMRLTVDSHSIEQHIWRVKNTSAVHVYMNDDYFVNRDVAITDLFNEYGGTIVRTEKGILGNGIRGPEQGGTWGEGVRHTQLFNIMELDLYHDDYLPASLRSEWVAEKTEKNFALSAPIPPVSLSRAVDAAHAYVDVEWPKNAKPRRQRRYATHAPFVYCTNMHRYLQTRYAHLFSSNAFKHRFRRGNDVYVPFVYNAFIMARPWVASPKFLPYLLDLYQGRDMLPTVAPEPVEIELTNVEACGQATLRGGRRASECLYAKFLDNATLNMATMNRIRDSNPLYFNINAGFSSAEAANLLRSFLHNKFPTPVYLEAADGGVAPDPEAAHAGEDEADKTTTTPAPAGTDAALAATFDALMQLPVVGIVYDEEGICPLVRSLPLAFAGHHRGHVHVSVQRALGGNTVHQPLHELRKSLGHRVISAMPGLRCFYNANVTSIIRSPKDSFEKIVENALAKAGKGVAAGVTLPSTCGGAVEGLRVRGFAVDARTPNAPVTTAAALREALAMPGQTLALEDFRAVRVGPEERDVVLVLSREDAEAKAVHWITGASENDLLLTYPLPVRAYEDMNAKVRWSEA